MMRRMFLFLLLVTAGLGVTGLAACGGSNEQENAPTAAAASSAGLATETSSASGAQASAPTRTRAAATRRPATATRAAQVNGYQTIAQADLPPQALKTLALIEKGGPFPYRQDGQVFQNREGILPKKANGYYHEYTVETPGSDDRGARRIVMGKDGTYYYTDDHYESFRIIVMP